MSEDEDTEVLGIKLLLDKKIIFMFELNLHRSALFNNM